MDVLWRARRAALQSDRWQEEPPAAGKLHAVSEASTEHDIELPAPTHDGRVSLEKTLAQRRSRRAFHPRPLSLAQLGQLLWAADGVSGRTDGQTLRTAPSAGALYPVDIYIVLGVRGICDLTAGVCGFLPRVRALRPVVGGDRRRAVAREAIGQSWMAEAPFALVITGEIERCARKYGTREVLYTQIDVGHIGQNVFLQAESLALGAGIVGAFDPGRLGRALGLPPERVPMSLLPIGTPR